MKGKLRFYTGLLSVPITNVAFFSGRYHYCLALGGPVTFMICFSDIMETGTISPRTQYGYGSRNYYGYNNYYGNNNTTITTATTTATATIITATTTTVITERNKASCVLRLEAILFGSRRQLATCALGPVPVPIRSKIYVRFGLKKNTE